MNEALLIENYLQNNLAPSDSLLMEARLLLEPELNAKAQWQKKTYDLITAYGRKELKKEIDAAQKKVFSENRFAIFQQTIKNIFR